MDLKDRIHLLGQLGDYIASDSEARQAAVLATERNNRWLTKANCLKALHNIADAFLSEDKLSAWLAGYPSLSLTGHPQKVGLVMAGNIPAVGFHDVLCTFLVGHKAYIKLSDKDSYLIPFMLDFLIEKDPKCANYFEITTKLKGFDAVIATGSNNSALYSEQYFGKYPNIIRKNRNSVAILNGEETDEDFLKLGVDIFRYFGLGCRSVSKLFVPPNYDFVPFLKVMDNYKNIMDHTKYRNNYEYNRSIYLLNNVIHLANDCLMIVEHESMLSRISSVHFEYYHSLEELKKVLTLEKDDIQCIATKMDLADTKTVGLGQTQSPELSDYADAIDSMAFLINLKN
jgi:hypothetical protein